MMSDQAGTWDSQPTSKHGSPLPQPPHTNPRNPHLASAAPAKRITFYKSGDSKFGGIRMAVHKRSFKCFDALLDDLSQKMPLPFGVRMVTTPRGTHTIRHLEQLKDGGCYLCSDQRQPKPINMELASKRPNIWHHQRPDPPETTISTPSDHLPYRRRRILLVKNREPGMRRSLVLSRSSARSLKAFLDEASEVMQFHVRKLYTAEGRRIDNVQSLMTCPGVLVCAGRESFSSQLVNFMRKTKEEKLPGLCSRSLALGPRTSGNGARSPATQGARSPIHGAQSRASEYSDGHESKKNVNFGLETKKSIIHPRSDSSNRSTRLSLSSEKSYSQSKPGIVNDDIEKRVLVNKDGSLSVEMRVRFRLQNDETLRWSTQIQKSPSLTKDCCPLSQAQAQYLQHGQSESCSDPDSTSFDPECVDDCSHVLEGNHCPCCYQRQKPQYDLWENPAHVLSQHPVPPPYAARHTHTIVRHTHSSSSSSSCNSRRVVRCRARLSKCSGGSGSEPGQLTREEMCVTEQVERTVEIEQSGDTHVEVCRVSRCSEVVALDSNLRPLSGKSGEDGLMMEDEEKQPVSTVSSSSHVLQLLKEDQDDDLPPSASQCSCRDEPSPTSESGPVHSCHSKHHSQVEEEGGAGFDRSLSRCRAPTPHSAADTDEPQTFKPTTSGASCRSDDEVEEIVRVVSSLSGHTDGSLQSSFCSHCGGFKRPINSLPNSRSSRRSRHSQNDDDEGNDDDDVVSNVSGVSAKSNQTSNHVTQSRACSALSNPETKDEDRTSARSRRSNRSHKSGCNGSTGLSEDHAGERSPSTMSAQSTKSQKSSNNGATEDTDVRKKVEEPGDNNRALSPLSAKTAASSKTAPSVKLYINDASQSDSTTGEDGSTDDRPASVKSNVSVQTNQSRRSNCSRCAAAESPCADEAASDKLQEESKETEERAASTNSRPPSKATERSMSSGSNPEDNNRSMSKMSGQSSQSKASAKSSNSHRSNCDVTQTVTTTLNITEGEDKNGEAIEEQKQRAESVASTTKSAENQGPTSESRDTTENDKDQEKAEITITEKRAQSAMSGMSKSTAKSSRPQKSNCSSPVDPKNEDELEWATSAMSAISKSSAKSPHSSGKSRPASVSPQRPSPDAATHAETTDAHNRISPKSTRSQKIHSPTVSPPPSSNPQSPVQQLLPETRGPSALSVHSVKSAKSARSKCSCGDASSNKETEEEEDKDVKSEELSEQPANVLSPASTKRMRKESRGTEEPLSRNSSGSISIALPEDNASSDSWKSSVSGRHRVKTRSPNVAVGNDVDESSESVVSQKSNFNESKSTHDLPIINIDTLKTPGQSQEGAEPNPVRASSAATSKSSRSHKSCHCSVKSGSLRSKGGGVEEQDDRPLPTTSSARAQVKHSQTPEGDSVKNVSRPTSKAKKKEDIDNNKASSIPSKSPCCLSPDVAPLGDSVKYPKTTSDGSVKSSRSKKKVEPTQSSSPCPAANTSPASKLDTCSGSTLSQSLSAADMLKESVAAARPSSHQSKTSKTIHKARSARHQEKENETSSGDLELTPTCLPNASPNEVVSEWLKGIPADSSMLDLSDDLHVEDEQEKVEENPVEEAAEGEGPEDKTLDEDEKSKRGEEIEEEELKVEGAAGETAVASQPNIPLMSTESVPRNWQSSAAVMKVLLSSSLGRCQSLPEVSPVYGRRLSTSAQGFLDCLAQLQLIEPAMHLSCDPQKGHRYEDIMSILQSLWLIEPRDIEAKEDKGIGTDRVTPPRSSSGVDMSSGSGGSGKEMGNQGGDEPGLNQTCGDAASTRPEEQEAKTQQDPVPASLDSPKVTENPSIEKCSHEDSSKSPTDHERETPEAPSMGSPPALLARKPSQDPDPVWILKLLKKLEKQFMNHYVSAMAEFKVRWDLDDSAILNTMMAELRDEVSQRIQSSIAREMKKIQSRTGRAERSARPPREPNVSRDSSMTERRRRMMRVLKNQSIKTADSITDEEMIGDFSDQRSEDEYCPCDACVRKKMAARPLKTNPAAAEAPVMMEFDLLKILQLKKGPLPSSTPAEEEEEEEVVLKEEVRSLEAVQEEEEEVEESKEDINSDVTLKETILEENEELEDGSEAEEKEEEVEEAQCGCQCAKDETEENVQEGEGETRNDAGEDEAAEDEEEEAEEERGESAGRESAEGEDTEDKATSEVTERQASEEEEEDSREEESPAEARGRGSDEGKTSEAEADASQGLEVPKAEEADDTEADQPREVEMEDEDTHGKQEEEKSTKEDGVLHHQFTRTSVESQPGSLEDINVPPNPVSSIEVPKTGSGDGVGGGGGGSSAGQRRSRSPARVKRRKPKECKEEDY